MIPSPALPLPQERKFADPALGGIIMDGGHPPSKRNKDAFGKGGKGQ